MRRFRGTHYQSKRRRPRVINPPTVESEGKNVHKLAIALAM